MGILSRFTKSNATEPITAVGNILDDLFTSDEERLSKEVVLTRLAQKITLVKAEIDKVQANHRSWWVYGARPFLLWVGGLCFFYLVVGRDLIVWASNIYFPGINIPPPVDLYTISPLAVVLLGGQAARTVDKVNGVAR
jgi:hypothetical protein